MSLLFLFFSVPLTIRRSCSVNSLFFFPDRSTSLISRDPDLYHTRYLRFPVKLVTHFLPNSPTRDPLNIYARRTVLVCCSPVREREVYFTAANSLWAHCNIDTPIRLLFPSSLSPLLNHPPSSRAIDTLTPGGLFFCSLLFLPAPGIPIKFCVLEAQGKTN